MTQVFAGTRVEVHRPPVLPPFPEGLYKYVDWVADGEGHFITNDGVVILPLNTVAVDQFGVYGAGWCDDPAPLDGRRISLEDADARPFLPEHVWANDLNECADLSAEARQEVEDRALNNFLRREQIAAERQFADRLQADITAASITPTAATSLRDALGKIADAAAELGYGGTLVHLRPYWLEQTEADQLDPSNRSNTHLQLVAGGGYVQGLGDLLVATTPVFGWRTTPDQQTAIEHRENTAYSLAQRSVMLGYEKLIAAIEIS